MNKERIKNGFAVALSALVCAGVVGSVAFVTLSLKKDNEFESNEHNKLSADYVQRIYVPESDAAGEDWKVRMNESAFKFGQNGYVVFAADGIHPPYEWGIDRNTSLSLPLYSNLYTEDSSYNAAEEIIYVSGACASSDYFRNNSWTKMTFSEQKFLAPDKNLNCPISRWASSMRWAMSTEKFSKNFLLSAQSKQPKYSPIFVGDLGTAGESVAGCRSTTSVIVDKSTTNDMYLTLYLFTFRGLDVFSGTSFDKTPAFASVYGYKDDEEPKFVSSYVGSENEDYIKDVSAVYGEKNYLVSAPVINQKAIGAYVTFKLSGVGRFQVVTGRCGDSGFVQCGGFFLDTII